MARKSVVLLSAAFAMLAVGVPHANATVVDSGECAVTVNFSFGSNPVNQTLKNHSYSFTIGNVLSGVSVKPCVLKGDSLTDVIRPTNGSGDGSGPWSCALVENAQGTAFQTWTDSAGTLDPPPLNGSHTISGTYGAWAMFLTSGLQFEGVIALTQNPSYSSEATNCQGPGTSTIHMIGIEVFEDPQL